MKENMKLNYKRTLLVGFAFFLILAFWQAYDTLIPKILTDKFGVNQFWSGVIMALDNVLALFLLPFFGSLSDKCKRPSGRRTPFIFVGTVAAAVIFLLLSFTDHMQLTRLTDITNVPGEAPIDNKIEERIEDFRFLYESDPVIRIDEEGVSKEKKLSEVYSEEAFLALAEKELTPSELETVTKARQAYAWRATAESPVTLIVFMVLLLFVLLSMAIFRSPAVALMPDVTPKPLRSKANAVINLMGSAGGISILAAGMFLGTGAPENSLASFLPLFIFTTALMVIALVIFRLTVKEPLWAKECAEISPDDGISDEEKLSGDRRLTKGEFISLIFILASVALWYMGYNAVTSKYSVYAGEVLSLDYNLTLMIAQGAAIIAYVPVGIISSKIGRKNAILIGVALLASVFFAASFMRSGSSVIVMNILFSLAGIAWATINVNSYPMVVELAGGSDVGKYTGFYYTASMAAQIITPIFSGYFLTYVGMTTLFPYAAIFVALAFITMIFVRHGDVKTEKTK